MGRFHARQERAKQRLANSPKGHWYFALVGVEFGDSSLGMEPLAHFQPVVEPPGAYPTAIAELKESGELSRIVPRSWPPSLGCIVNQTCSEFREAENRTEWFAT
jgi:hypothetical protein